MKTRQWLAAAAALTTAAIAWAGSETVSAQQARFGGLADGPYTRLVIRNAMVIPGHGGPPIGPYDIVIKNNVIAEMTSFGSVDAAARGTTDRVAGDRVIDATGMYVMPGMIDLHMHLREEPMELEYVYYLKLAHGVTTLVPAADRGLKAAMEQARLSERNEILAPRMFPIWNWGAESGATREQLENPADAARIATMMKQKGMHVVSVGGQGWNPELFGAVCKAVWDAGGITTVHLPPSTNAVVNAVDAAKRGVTMIEHHYGYAEASLDRRTQAFPRDYDFNNENHRFREAGRVWEEANRERLLGEVAQDLVDSGVTMLPTRVVYEANRDIVRAESLPWHEKYTHEALIQWNVPNPSHHGSFHYDWTSDDEYTWTHAFRLWGDLIFEFNKRGGRVAYGTDDNFIWATPGFSNVRELQLVRESGLHNLEVLKSATFNSAQTLRQPKLGLVRPGYLADLVLVDGNPAENLRHLYSFGAVRKRENGQMYRTRGIVHTIKDGIVIDNAKVMDEVEKLVARSKRNAPSNITNAPFLPGRRVTSTSSSAGRVK
jgi:imidazolonepropionase-like amidohydrolase